ncbi:hypothetical protein [Streptomyces sp. 7-21]|jgi:hypothetical protein|uniref:hypothetical protein n=1 Tax=Streptomyces sp. 7-21 TaxID=2802283 RepID=UPI00191F9C7F|nr:hypothetical protein [Streptomyces sp. 7-21]MBL1066442.1 hypothetical protein [Streptomyces sp. 7-21]
MRQVNPDDLERLADLLDAKDGGSGTAWEIQQLFNRASELGARAELSPLEPVQTWATETASGLRRRAGIARSDEEWYLEAYGFVGDLKGAVSAMVSALGSWKITKLLAGQSLLTGGLVAPVGRFQASLAALGAGGSVLPGLAGREAQQLVTSVNQIASRLGWSSSLGGRVATILGGTPAALTQSLFQAGRYAGFLRYTGFIGGLISTGTGIADLISQGNPVTAFQNDPSGYSVDVAGTVSAATMTLALAFPGPGTAVAAIIAAGFWVGTLVWDNWDDIKEWGSQAIDWTTDAWNASTDWVSDRASDVVDAGRSIVDGAGDVLGSLF